MKLEDIENILDILAPYGINLIKDSSVNDDLIFKVFVPKDSEIKHSNRYIRGEAATRFTKDTINKYLENHDIHISYGIDFEEIDITWTKSMSEFIKQKASI